jgi:hypothetical protein
MESNPIPAASPQTFDLNPRAIFIPKEGIRESPEDQ